MIHTALWKGTFRLLFLAVNFQIWGLHGPYPLQGAVFLRSGIEWVCFLLASKGKWVAFQAAAILKRQMKPRYWFLYHSLVPTERTGNWRRKWVLAQSGRKNIMLGCCYLNYFHEQFLRFNYLLPWKKKRHFSGVQCSPDCFLWIANF